MDVERTLVVGVEGGRSLSTVSVPLLVTESLQVSLGRTQVIVRMGMSLRLLALHIHQGSATVVPRTRGGNHKSHYHSTSTLTTYNRHSHLLLSTPTIKMGLSSGSLNSAHARPQDSRTPCRTLKTADGPRRNTPRSHENNIVPSRHPTSAHSTVP